MEASWEGGGGFHVGTLRLKGDKPALTRMRRRRVYPEDLGKPLSPSKETRKGKLGQHLYQAGLTTIHARTSRGLNLTVAIAPSKVPTPNSSQRNTMALFFCRRTNRGPEHCSLNASQISLTHELQM